MRRQDEQLTRKELRQEERLRTAFHEAGHAVAAVYCGKPLRFVMLGKLPRQHQAYSPHSTGYTHNDNVKFKTLDDLSDDWLQRTIFCCFAGPAVEFSAFPDSPPIVAADDVQRASGYATLLGRRYQFTDNGIARLLTGLWNRAAVFVEEEADKVERVASALLEHGIVTGNEVRAICEYEPQPEDRAA